MFLPLFFLLFPYSLFPIPYSLSPSRSPDPLPLLFSSPLFPSFSPLFSPLPLSLSLCIRVPVFVCFPLPLSLSPSLLSPSVVPLFPPYSYSLFPFSPPYSFPHFPSRSPDLPPPPLFLSPLSFLSSLLSFPRRLVSLLPSSFYSFSYAHVYLLFLHSVFSSSVFLSFFHRSSPSPSPFHLPSSLLLALLCTASFKYSSFAPILSPISPFSTFNVDANSSPSAFVFTPMS